MIKTEEEVIIKTLLLISSIDGSMEEEEAKKLKKWANDRMRYFDLDRKRTEKARYNKYIKEGYFEIKNKELNLEKLLVNIDILMDKNEKYEFYVLCLEMVGSDEKAFKEELQLLKKIEKLMNLDEVYCRQQRYKIVPVNMYLGDIDKEPLIGITKSMTLTERKSHLTGEYKKWNVRVGHSDPKIREQAEQMIHIIAELRKEYKN